MKRSVTNRRRIPYPVIRPSLPDLDRLRREMEEMWASGLVTAGVRVRAFEAAVEKTLRVRHAVAVSSCTSGLILAVKALALKGEVLLPAFTFAATAHALVWNGVKPVFCDSEPGTRNLDPRDVERKITRRTSAILPVALFGVPPRVEEFAAIAMRHGLRLIYDSAQALGARVGGKCVGGFGDMEVFSLSPTKVVTAIEGGMVTTNDGALAAAIRKLRDYGKADDGEDMAFVGLSARMSELHAAVGLGNLERMQDLIAHRGSLVALYRELLAGIPGVGFQEIPPGVWPSHNYMVVFVGAPGGVTRDRLHFALGDRGIQTKRYFHPAVHEMTAYHRLAGKFVGKLPVAERSSREGLALPLHGGLDAKDVEFICDRVRKILRRPPSRSPR